MKTVSTEGVVARPRGARNLLFTVCSECAGEVGSDCFGELSRVAYKFTGEVAWPIPTLVWT
jgi:hypothetical protein